MSELQDLARVFDGDDVSWIHDGFRTEKELAERGDRYIEFLFCPFPDLKLESGFRPLEIGSGLGYIMEALERYARIQRLQVGRIIGVDIAANMLEKAKARISSPRFEFLKYDGVHIPLEDGALDFVYSVASLQHIPKPFVYNLFFEIKRLLSPTGFSLLHLIGFSHMPACTAPYATWADIVRNQVSGGERLQRFIYFYSVDELRWVLGDGTGFKDVRVVEVGNALAVALTNLPRPAG
jgi:cyclopropane fatty-acyl-phospholipid synthase-like methyltransferase